MEHDSRVLSSCRGHYGRYGHYGQKFLNFIQSKRCVTHLLKELDFLFLYNIKLFHKSDQIITYC